MLYVKTITYHPFHLGLDRSVKKEYCVGHENSNQIWKANKRQSEAALEGGL